jgi:hypothetical protein
MNTELRRLRNLSRIALTRWKLAAARRHAAVDRPRMDRAAWAAETQRMDILDRAVTRFIGKMAAL